MMDNFFGINKLADDIKSLVQLMLNGEYGEEISNRLKDTINWFRDLKEGLRRDPNYKEAFILLLETIITQSWYYNVDESKLHDLAMYIKSRDINDLVESERKKLISIVVSIVPRRIRDDVKNKVDNLLNELKTRTLFDWSKELYKASIEGKRSNIIGEKGRDDYLRSIGFWDRVPMDRHEMRFIIRTGIYHALGSKEKSDPLEKSHLQSSLVTFCQKYLKGFIVEEIDLGRAPGVFDIFIWRYSKKPTKKEPGCGICGKDPKCDKCKLKDSCLYSILRKKDHDA